MKHYSVNLVADSFLDATKMLDEHFPKRFLETWEYDEAWLEYHITFYSEREVTNEGTIN